MPLMAVAGRGPQGEAHLDTGSYPEGIKITNAQLTAVPLTPHGFHGNWNYTVHPAQPAAG